MTLSFKTIVLLAFSCVMFSTSLIAETLHVKNGPAVHGKILTSTEETITVQIAEDHSIVLVNKADVLFINFADQVEENLESQKKGPVISVVYMRNGEVVKGMIKQYNSEFLIIESEKGEGQLRIPAREINMITAKNRSLPMNQRTGIGFVSHKSTLSGGNSESYNSDQISYKFFLEENLFSGLLFAFGNSSNSAGSTKIFAADYRMGLVFERFQNILLYYGGSVGYLQLKDTANSINGSGYSLKGFVGAEFFFSSMPNFGFAGELGVSMQQAGSFSSFELSSSSFPALTIHYYF